MRSYTSAFKGASDFEAVADFITQASSRNPEDVTKALSMLMRKPAEEILLNNVDDGLDLIELTEAVFERHRVQEIVMYGIAFGIID